MVMYEGEEANRVDWLIEEGENIRKQNLERDRKIQTRRLRKPPQGRWHYLGGYRALART